MQGDSMKNIYSDEGVRTRLILAALDELSEHGIEDFSLRRVAISAQVSCAAPYRHFKGKEELIAETARYITSKWTLLADEIIASYAPDLRRTLIELSCAAAKFWIANGKFRSLLLPDAASPLAEEMKLFDIPVAQISDRLFASVGCSEDECARLRTRTLATIYGTVMLVSTGKLAATAAAETVEDELRFLLASCGA